MTLRFWQINPALLIQDKLDEQTLAFGQMPKHAFDLKDSYPEIKSIIFTLKVLKKFTFTEFENAVQGCTFNALDLFEDLTNLKVVIRAIDANSRYSRHHYYYGFNGVTEDAQNILKNKTVLLIGVGGIGSTCAMLLTAAGIGNIILADEDLLEESNLTRSVLFNTADIGKLKITTAKDILMAKNNNVNFETIPYRLSNTNFEKFKIPSSKADFIILSGDSGPEVHHLAYTLSKEFFIPLLNAGYVETFGIVGPTTKGSDKRRELENSLDTPFTERPFAASYGPLNTIVSSIAVNEVIRSFLNLPYETKNSRLIIDSSNYDIQKEVWL